MSLKTHLTGLAVNPHDHKVFIAGNHDAALAEPSTRSIALSAHPELIYLEGSFVIINVRGRDIQIDGSPQTPRHGSWPFQYPRVPADEAFTSTIWSDVPIHTDVLVTHGPPAYHLDLRGSGCPVLLHAIWRIRPKLHVFGHIHAGYDLEYAQWSEAQRTYEDICAGHSGWLSLFAMVRKVLRKAVGWNLHHSLGTIMINASVVGGVRDERRNEAVDTAFNSRELEYC
ncbi:unnamed protein product [Somion occarium]|uniref:Calcineurin-like phosphoesterase domain-containing protein n=1 Tax=Somion occarium TaxID=3059160 RepID=A0ABP1DSH5_9APHY